MHSELKQQLQDLIRQCTGELSTELVEWNVKKRSNIIVIDIIADKVGGGITIDECTAINKKVVGVLEENQWFGEDFVVEVSSPGLDRDLKTAGDFNRAIGRKIRVHLLEPIEGKVEHHGMIAAAEETNIQLQCNGTMITIPLDVISKAVQIIEIE